MSNRDFDELFYRALEAAGGPEKHPIIRRSSSPGGVPMAEVAGRSRNLRGVIAKFGKTPLSYIDITPIGERGSAGLLRVKFDDGSLYETKFASYDVLKHWIAGRLNVRGAPLRVAGKPAGTVSRSNPALRA